MYSKNKYVYSQNPLFAPKQPYRISDFEMDELLLPLFLDNVDEVDDWLENDLMMFEKEKSNYKRDDKWKEFDEFFKDIE
ncbi:hypothetical protein [Pontibacter virosus]|uniref:Uncharacterized protein n=1 Tax=Pontibacter virosus TaxID=1765052 RepID=A0A2U1B3J2_9BACT|nr:hypothetical protein [Pontibacter virosus]PVY43162.1 hypothetical protein C8E01_102339 [Pontibacter virosus]